MRKIRTLLAALLLAFTSMTASAQPMSYMSMCNNARFITDRMAYTLGITAIDLIDDLFRINFDYICGVNDYLDDVAMGYRYNDYMAVCYERDRAIQRLLGMTLWNRVMTYDYFYRPIVFNDCRWSFGIYVHDSNIHHFYHHVPRYYNTYHGGHYFAGMRPYPGGGRGPRGVIPSRRDYHHPGFNQPAHRDGGVAHRDGGNSNSGYHVGNTSHNSDGYNRNPGNASDYNRNPGNTSDYNRNPGNAGGYSHNQVNTSNSSINPNRGGHGGYNGTTNVGGRNSGSIGNSGGNRGNSSRSTTNFNSSSRSSHTRSSGSANRTGGTSGSHRSGGHR